MCLYRGLAVPQRFSYIAVRKCESALRTPGLGLFGEVAYLPLKGA